MTTRAGKWWQTPVWKVPKWAWIGMVVAVMAFAVIGALMGMSDNAEKPAVVSAPVAVPQPATLPISVDKPIAPVAQSQGQTAPSSAVSQEPSVPAGVLVFKSVEELAEAGRWLINQPRIPYGTVVQVGGITNLPEKNVFLYPEALSIVDQSQGYTEKAICWSPGADRLGKGPLHNIEGIAKGQWVIVRGEYNGPPMSTSPRALLNCTIVR